MPPFSSARRAFGRPLRLLWQYRARVLTGLALLPVHAAVTLWMPAVLGSAVDLISGEAREPEAALDPAASLRAACVLLAALALVEAVSRFFARLLLIDASRRVEERLKNEAVAHLQRLPIGWFDRSRTGDLTSRLTQDVELVRFVMGPLLLHGGTTVCLLPAGIWLMLRMNVSVTLAAVAVFGVLFCGYRAVMPRLHRWSRRSQEAIAQIAQQAQEDFAGIRVVQQFAIMRREEEAMATRNRRFLLANLRLVRLRALLNALTHTTGGAVTLAVLSVGGYEVIQGSITVGQLFQFLSYLGLMIFPLEILGWVLAMLPRAQAAALRVAELFEVEPEAREGLRPTLRGHLRVENLTFTYPGTDRPALRDVSFTLEPGGKLGLAGPVGSGKSTLIALLLRLYDPPRGTIFVDDHDLLDLDPIAVRSLFALASQEPFLFSDSVANNVAFGLDDAERTRIDDAVAAAALDQDVPQLQHGLETIVGERGVTLSGGQKQRVSLARALLSDRPGLLLDDTLSAVDAATEQRILRGLKEERHGRTMVVATHRLSVIADADLILVLEDGRVTARGDHRTLVRHEGLYANAWRLQTEARSLESELDGTDDGGGRP